MAKRKKNQASEEVQIVETIEDFTEVTTYKEFFQVCLAKGRLKHWQEKEVQAFFKSSGLKDKEPTSKYEDALRKY